MDYIGNETWICHKNIAIQKLHYHRQSPHPEPRRAEEARGAGRNGAFVCSPRLRIKEGKGREVMNTITITLCQEDRTRLDKIIEALEQVSFVAQDKTQPEPIPEAEAPTEVQETAETFNEETASEPVEEPAKIIDLSDIQKKVVELSAAGKKAEVRDIITKYANRVSAIPAEHTAEVWNQLIGLKN